MRGFVLGVILTLLVLIGSGYYLLRSGKISMAATAKPLPGEEQVADLAIEGSIGKGKDIPNPLPLTDENLLAGANLYKERCVFCHGIPGQRAALAEMMFPHPPQLFEKDDMVVDDPSGSVYWIISNGIRLSAMPSFSHHLSDNERWQLTLLLSHADKLPGPVQAELAKKEANEIMAPGHAHEHEHENHEPMHEP